MPGGLPRIPGHALVFQLGFRCTEHALALGEKPTSDVAGSCSVRHAERHIAPMLSDNSGSDFSASVANLAKVRASLHTQEFIKS